MVFACFILLQPHEHNKLEPRSRLCCFLGYVETQKGYRCYELVSYCLRVSCNIVFWEHRYFIELSYFCASLSSSSVLDLFPEEAHIPSASTPDPPVVAHDSPVDFSIQPLDIFDASPRSCSDEQMEDEQVENEIPNLELGSPNPTPPKDLAQDIPPCHLTRVRSIPAHLLDYHYYITIATLHEPHTYHEASTNPLW